MDKLKLQHLFFRYRLSIVILYLAVFSLLNTFCSITKTAKKNSKKSFWAKRDFNFGFLKEGQNYSFQLKFDNETNQTIEILSLEPSCGCVGAYISKRIIEPGKEINIRITLDTTAKIGKIIKIVNVNVKNSSKPLILTLRADVRHGKNKLVAAGVIFRGNCRKCHIGRKIKFKQGEILYNAICYMCHKEVLNLGGNSKTSLGNSISNGVPGTSMPGFLKKNGGPLNPEQINSLINFIKEKKAN